MLNAQVLVLRHVQVPDRVNVDDFMTVKREHSLTFLPSLEQVLEEVDGDVVVWREEDSDITGEKVVDLALASVLRRELLGRYMSNLGVWVCDLVHVLIVLFH